MLNQQLTVALSDLESVRIVCTRADCGGAIEVPADKLNKLASARCPVCEHEFDLGKHNPNPLIRLRAVLDDMAALAEHVRVEFVIPVED